MKYAKHVNRVTRSMRRANNGMSGYPGFCAGRREAERRVRQAERAKLKAPWIGPPSGEPIMDDVLKMIETLHRNRNVE